MIGSKYFVVVLVGLSMLMGSTALAQSCREVPISQMQAEEETSGQKKTPRHRTVYWPDFVVPMSIKKDLTYEWDSEIECGLFEPVAENQGYYARWEYVGWGNDARGSECVNPEVRGVSPKGRVSVTVLYRGVPSVTCEYTGWGAGQGPCTTLKPIMYGEDCDAAVPQASSNVDSSGTGASDGVSEGGGAGGWVIPAAVLLALMLGGAVIARRKANPLIMHEPTVADAPESKPREKNNCDVYQERVKACEARVTDLEYDLDHSRDKLEDAVKAAQREADELYDRGTNDVEYYEGKVERLKAELAKAEGELTQAEKDLEICMSA